MPLPSTFVGHRSQIDDLSRDIAQGNVAHGYLFQGPSHVGKFTVAKWLAEELLVRGVEDPEEERRIRSSVGKLLHPDLLVIDLLWREELMEDLDVLARHSNVSQAHRIKMGAKTDTIGIDDVRALQERLYEIPEGLHRCCLLKNVERLQDEAVNALLKVLEEPPKGLVFILTSSTPEQVLPTLLSRCRRINFSLLPRKELRPLVQGLDDDEASFLLHLCQGAPGVIEALKNDPERLRIEHQLASSARSFWTEPSAFTRMQMLTPLHTRDADADRFTLHLALALRTLPPALALQSFSAFRRYLRGAETNVSRPLLCAELAFVSGKEADIAATRAS